MQSETIDLGIKNRVGFLDRVNMSALRPPFPPFLFFALKTQTGYVGKLDNMVENFCWKKKTPFAFVKISNFQLNY